MPFVAPPKGATLRPIVEAAFGYSISSDPGTWVFTDITKYVQLNDGGQQAALSAGAPDQAQDADPSQISITLKNTDGRFTALNPMSPYWPNVVRNVPLRFSITWDGASAVYELLTAFVNGWPIQPNAGVINVTVPITATGRLRRLRASSSPPKSALRGSVQAYAPVRSYWPLENGDLQAVTAVTNSAVVTGQPTWAAADGLPGSDTLPVLNTTSSFTGYVTAGTFVTTGWQIDCYMMVPAVPAASVTLVRANMPTTSSQAAYQVDLTNSTTITVSSFDGVGAVLHSFTITPITGFVGEWQHLRLTVDTPGANQIVTLATLPIDGSAGLTGNVSFIGTLAPPPLSVSVPGNVNMAGVQFGHVIVSDGAANTAVDGAGGGWTGELAPARVTRVCAENNLPVNVTTSGSVAAQAMGPQTVATVATVLSDCANADNGLLHDAGPLGNLVYVSGTVRYNAAVAFTLNYLTRQIGDGLAATYDDQQLVTDWTISRPGGGSANVQDPTATDDYARSATLNVATDNQCVNLAGWLVHLGTYDAYRMPSLSVDIRNRSPELAQAVTSLAIPARVSPTNLPSPYPPQSFDQFIEGWSARVDSVTWQVDFNCSPYMPWQIGVYDTSKYDSATSTLQFTINKDAPGVVASMLVLTSNPAELWTLDSSQWTVGANGPLFIKVGNAEVMRVTNITGASSPQTFTCIRGVNGITLAHQAGASVHLATPTVVGI